MWKIIVDTLSHPWQDGDPTYYEGYISRISSLNNKFIFHMAQNKDNVIVYFNKFEIFK
jgi:hypothetical protein